MNIILNISKNLNYQNYLKIIEKYNKLKLGKGRGYCEIKINLALVTGHSWYKAGLS